MKLTTLTGAACTLLLLLAGTAYSDHAVVEGVFGLAPIPPGAALAVWVPLEEGESISGIVWYNNDEDVAFPELLAVAGAAETPQILQDALVVGENVVGRSGGWSEFIFPQPLASGTDGLYVVFRLPVGADFGHEGQGGGAGVGYCLGSGPNRSWIALGEETWCAVNEEYQMAVDVVMNEAKSGDILVLQRSADQAEEVAPEDPSALPTIFRCVASPNPFNSSTEVAFDLPIGGDVDLSVFDIRGRHICTLAGGWLAAGSHVAQWNGCDQVGRAQSSGVYIASLKAGAVRMTQRLTLVR